MIMLPLSNNINHEGVDEAIITRNYMEAKKYMASFFYEMGKVPKAP